MAIDIRSLHSFDVPWAEELVSVAGWNQLPKDWLRLISYQPAGCFKALLDSRPVATLTTTAYGSQLAWIGMMLVAPEVRRRGLGKALMQHAIEYLSASGVKTIKLDATPAGRPLYEQLGFEVEWEFQRWHALLPPKKQGPMDLLNNSPACLRTLDSAAIQLDHRAFGVDRGRWLNELASDSSIASNPHGFGMLRSGRIASYLGPIVSADAESAGHTVKQLLRECTPGPCFWDVPAPNQTAVALAESWGFQPTRTLFRMWRGEPFTAPMLDQQFAIADPAVG